MKGVSFVGRQIDSVCAEINEWQPTLTNWKILTSRKVHRNPLRPKAHLWCSPGQVISSVRFASFGTPEGTCGNFLQGSCHAFHSYDVFERVCWLLSKRYACCACVDISFAVNALEFDLFHVQGLVM